MILFAAPLAYMAAYSCSKTQHQSIAANYGPISIEPTSGSGREQIFKLTLSTPEHLTLLGLLINDDLTGRNSCYVLYSFTRNDDLLVNDSGSGSRTLGTAPFLANSQCSIIKDGSAASISGNMIVVAFHIRFNEDFRGTKSLYVIAQKGSAVQGPTKAGTWDMWDVR